MCQPGAGVHGLSIVFRQSNREGEIVDFLQEARTQRLPVLIINAAGYTHTSIAILDLLIQNAEGPSIEGASVELLVQANPIAIIS